MMNFPQLDRTELRGKVTAPLPVSAVPPWAVWAGLLPATASTASLPLSPRPLPRRSGQTWKAYTQSSIEGYIFSPRRTSPVSASSIHTNALSKTEEISISTW